ncbi:Domain of uncharacterised function (DUF2825) [Salmonella enterica subsp. enterica]|uniref:Domain of uncharacterized function (DUF2825) n=1 Tax=Salmonella enterica I TaxID=59201 RepID=A0A379VMN5_SALET|nr:Domain of uncharacterised function (DUF2825) [Salmonella enterica subsp. enterica]
MRRCDFAAGLSPLARGTLPIATEFGIVDRFIPAGAGNTYFRYVYGEELPVYPRWRGEHEMSRMYGSAVSGLSPLARGTH